MKTGTLYSPRGTEIVGTLDDCPGLARISCVEQDSDGKLVIEYEGETEMFWDDQKVRTLDGENLYLDSEGLEWPESACIFVPEGDPLPKFKKNFVLPEPKPASIYLLIESWGAYEDYEERILAWTADKAAAKAAAAKGTEQHREGPYWGCRYRVDEVPALTDELINNLKP